MSVIEAADLLIDKSTRDYPKDIAVVVLMGSQVHGGTHR